MTQEQKQLLLKDLCSRLPYGVKVSVSGNDFDNYQYPYLLTSISKFGQDILCKVYSPIYIPLGCPSIENVKPYLRPMSSMTEEERKEIAKAIQKDYINPSGEIKTNGVDNLLLCVCKQSTNLQDLLNAHHFDYRGLIEKGLAMKPPEYMYKTE